MASKRRNSRQNVDGTTPPPHSNVPLHSIEYPIYIQTNPFTVRHDWVRVVLWEEFNRIGYPNCFGSSHDTTITSVVFAGWANIETS